MRGTVRPAKGVHTMLIKINLCISLESVVTFPRWLPVSQPAEIGLSELKRGATVATERATENSIMTAHHKQVNSACVIILAARRRDKSCGLILRNTVVSSENCLLHRQPGWLTPSKRLL